MWADAILLHVLWMYGYFSYRVRFRVGSVSLLWDLVLLLCDHFMAAIWTY